MYECEIKLFEINKETIETKLQLIGAKSLGSYFIVDIYLKASNPKLVRGRVRYTAKKTLLTYKWKLPVGKTKHAYEFDTQLPKEFTIQHDSRNDLVDHCRVKKRTTYTWGGYQFDIDEYIGLPPILEIEGPNELSIFQLISNLGRQIYKHSSCGGKGVYNYYNMNYPEMSSGFVGRLLSLIRCG